MSFSINVKGFEKVSRKLTQLPDKIKRRKLLGIMRSAAKPMLEHIKSKTPEHDKTVVRKNNRGEVFTYKPGNLAESMIIMTGKKGRSKVNPQLWLGPGVGKKKEFDGYYGYFVVKGIVRGTARKGPNRFMEEAALAKKKTTQDNIEKGIVRIVKREAKKLGLDVKRL